VILDFNGDIFPSDTHIIRVLTNALEVLTIRQFGVPVIEFASSPGPFNTGFRRFISKLVFNKISVIVNREPISSELLKQIGINKTPIVNAACPAFLLEPASVKRAKEILLLENIDVKVRPLIGVTLSGYNLISQRTWGTPKNFNDLSLFVPMIKYLLDDLNASVFLLPHVYRVNPYTSIGEHINGPDHDILLHLYRMADGDKYNGRLRLIEGKYTSSEAKGVIGQCDMYISGRVHAGVAALSQAIPTILLAYGHKHRGFASLVHQEKYVFEGTDSRELKLIVEDAWENREEITKVLKERMARIEELVNLNFEIVKEIVDLNEEERDHIPKEICAAWVRRRK
jgi:colanic acid/amylovoran biosynthesis protein